jgi:hypothetical protein
MDNKEKTQQPAVDLPKAPKDIEIKIPISDLNPDDKFLRIRVNGLIYTVERGKTVSLKENVVKALKDVNIL